MIQSLTQLFRRPPTDQCTPPTVEDFRIVLGRERDRSDRTQAPVSLVSLDYNQSPEVKHLMPTTVAFLRGRLRSTDDFGLLDTNRLGIVLPATDSMGAWTVALDVCGAIECLPRQLNCEVFEYPDPSDFDGDSIDNLDMNDGIPSPSRPLAELFCRPMPLWKRGVDVFGAGIGLLLCGPLFCLVAIAIKATSKGPVFFRQTRSGLGRKPFIMYKFRTMVVDAEQRQAALRDDSDQDGPAFKLQNDPRITSIGHLLRKTSIDELPQLWNVLCGQMSLVGPRPLPCSETDACESWHHRRLDTTPGLTCIWQVSRHSFIHFDDWMRMDVRYVRSQTPVNDAKLLARTIPAVVMRRGAH